MVYKYSEKWVGGETNDQKKKKKFILVQNNFQFILLFLMQGFNVP